MKARNLLVAVAATALLSAAGPLAADTPTHARHFSTYEGTKTCLQCHEEQAREIFNSQHYQWEGSADSLVNDPGRPLGKMSMINDFCTNPVASWIGQVKNKEGAVVATGCSKCHAGRGLLPSRTESREQLENIDCLICHANGYRRDVYMNDVDEKGQWEWKSIIWKNQEGLDSVAKRISTPTRSMCLRCHNASGGGANIKRGDMDYKLADADFDFDVHMGTDGMDMSCTACHAAGGHHVVGRGSDLASNDSPGERIGCSGACHTQEPHESDRLNMHAEVIECSTCHIPTFARDEPTEMVRDWSKVVYNEEKAKYAPTQVLEQNVTPVYAWYNGTSWMQLPGEPVELSDDGAIRSAVPVGSRDDPGAKITPFKLHKGVMPVSNDNNWLLPIAVEDCFGSGDVNEAVKEATEKLYGIKDVDYRWLPTVRYMMISHGVQPMDNALGCNDCHGKNGRLDWKALGYDGDPRAR